MSVIFPIIRYMFENLKIMGKIYFYIGILFWPFTCFDFVPIESLILGNVLTDKEVMLNTEVELDISKYTKLQKKSQELSDSCSWRNRQKYISVEEKNVDILNYISSIQYGSLNAVVKNISALAKRSNFSIEEFQVFSNNIVTNFCSDNLTIISKKELNNNLNYYFKMLSYEKKTIHIGPYNNVLNGLVNPDSYVRNQLNAAVHAFRALCSWGGTPSDLGLLNPILKSPHIVSYILEKIGEEHLDFLPIKCSNLICRSTELVKDDRVMFVAIAKEYYCYYFSDVKIRPNPKNETLALWTKETTDDDFIYQTAQVISALTNQPNLLAIADGVNNKEIFSSRFDDFFSNWSNTKLEYFSVNIPYEERLNLSKVRIEKDGDRREITFDVSYGEIDQARNLIGKINTKFIFKLDRKLLSYIHNEIEYPANWSLKKERHLKMVIREHLIESSYEVFSNYFAFIDKQYFFDEISDAIFNDISNGGSHFLKAFSGTYNLNFYFGHFALNYLRKMKRTRF
jgi:hypothetical protein